MILLLMRRNTVTQSFFREQRTAYAMMVNVVLSDVAPVSWSGATLSDRASFDSAGSHT
jgi:hypothetical protein